MALCCTVSRITVQYSTEYSTVHYQYQYTYKYTYQYNYKYKYKYHKYSTVPYRTVQYIQYSTVLCCTVYSTVLYCTERDHSTICREAHGVALRSPLLVDSTLYSSTVQYSSAVSAAQYSIELHGTVHTVRYARGLSRMAEYSIQ